MGVELHRRLTRPGHRHADGQSLVEFAIVLPVFMFIVGGIIQFGIIFWGQNTLTQIARDTGRWAATQQSCSDSAAVESQANAIAAESSLIGYRSAVSPNPSSLGVTVTWQDTDGTTSPPSSPCPPKDNTVARWVTVKLTQAVPVFFPFIPGNGSLATSTQFRMEPAPQP